MLRVTKVLAILVLVNIFLSITINFFNVKTMAASTVKQQISSDIDGINGDKYPGIETRIKSLQKKHPNWNFKILYTGLKWSDVINGETSKHGTNVVSKSIYGKEWICPTCGEDKLYSGGSWYCASDDAVKYMMDARNSLNDTDIFQFLELSYDSKANYDKSAIKEILEDTFLDDGKLDTYVNQIMTSCKKYDVNPYYVAAKIIQEQGTKGGSTFKMLGSTGNGKYKIDEEQKIITVAEGTKVKQLKQYLGDDVVVKDANKKKITNENTKVATAYYVDNYRIAVLGDLNGDGQVKSADYMRVKNYILGRSKLSAHQMLAADVNEDGKIKSADYMQIKNDILGRSKIELDGETYYYNIFNIGATGNTTSTIVENALERAREEGWSSIEKCLDGGIEFIADGYISIGQDTMYFEKFNVVNTTKGYSYYTHQYAQDLLYAQNQGTKLRSILLDIDAIDNAYTFVIPVYESMPTAACARPISK